MTGVALALCSGGPAAECVAAELFPAAEIAAVTPSDVRPRTPFTGRLFALLAAQPRGSCVGLVVPVALAGTVPSSSASDGGLPASGEETPPGSPVAGPSAAARCAGALLPVADHLNLELCGPLTGRWPAGVPRDFPSLTGIYQPSVVRAVGGPRVYSSGVVVAGVADRGQLTSFESRAVREVGVSIVSDFLVPVAIVAAYHGLRLAACGVLQGPDRDRE